MRRHVFLTLIAHWRRHPLQLGLLIVGLALATGLWTGVQAINAEARASYTRAAEGLALQGAPAITAKAGMVSTESYVSLRRAGWQVTPILEGRWSGPVRQWSVLGVDVLTHPLMQAMTESNRDLGAQADGAPLLMGAEMVFAHPETAEQLRRAPFDVVPAIQLPPGVLVADISFAQALLADRTGFSSLLVLPTQPADAAPLVDIAPGLIQRAELSNLIGDPAELTQSFHLNLSAFALLSFAVGLFIVQGSITLGIEQRRRSILILRALGASGRAVAVALSLELILLTLFAATLGMIMGHVLAAALLPGVSATLSDLYGANSQTTIELRASWVLYGYAMALAGMGLASLQALWRLRSMLRTVRGAQSAPLRSAHPWLTRLAAIGAAMIAAGLIIPWAAEGLLAGFMGIGAMMLGAAMLFVPALAAVLRLMSRLTDRPVAHWLIADSAAQIPGFGLALIALYLAIATNIGVGTMVSSFRLTFVEWIDNRLAADVYVGTSDLEAAKAVLRWAEISGAIALPQYRSETYLQDQRITVAGIVDAQVYRDVWPLVNSTSDPWSAFFDSQGVLVNEQFHYKYDAEIGDMLRLTEDWSAPVVGIYADYGNPRGEIVTAATALRASGLPIEIRRVGLIAAPRPVSVLEQELYTDLKVPPETVVLKSTIRRASLAVFDRTFLITGALNVLTLGVASFALVTSFLSRWNQRLPQLAPLWSMGVPLRSLAMFELIRSISLSILTFLAALPLGLTFAWYLLKVINVRAFGWQLPMWVFPADLALLLALTALAGMLAAVIPCLRLIGTAPAQLIGVFSHEE